MREIGIRTFTEWLDAPMEDVVLYANPGSYAREYAASNGLRHSCIRHAALVRDAAVAATCGTAGKTEGSHCPECGVVVLEQREVAPTGLHSWDGGTVTVRPTTVTAMRRGSPPGRRPRSARSSGMGVALCTVSPGQERKAWSLR